MLCQINTMLTCCSISPLNGLMTIPIALSLKAKGAKNMQIDFPDPVAIRTKTSLPCSRGRSASSWPSRKLENEEYFCRTSQSLPYIEQLVSDMQSLAGSWTSYGHLQKRLVTDSLLAEAIPGCQLIGIVANFESARQFLVQTTIAHVIVVKCFVVLCNWQKPWLSFQLYKPSLYFCLSYELLDHTVGPVDTHSKRSYIATSYVCLDLFWNSGHNHLTNNP